MLRISIDLRRGGRGIALATALLFAGSTLPAEAPSSGKPKEFIQGIKALDKNRLKESETFMQGAEAKLPGDGELVRIYGTRYEPYLPLYYLGLALYRQGDCPGALVHWRRCLSSGALQRTDRRDALLQYIEEAGSCQNQ